jgi:tRNA A37 methylthiotransferase MiaB
MINLLVLTIVFMKYFIQVYGCQMNRSDAERISALFESLGLLPADKMADADIIVAVMCSVRQMAADRVLGLEQKFKLIKKTKPGLKTVLTGCIVENDKTRFTLIFDHTLDIKTLPEWPKILNLGHRVRRSRKPASSQILPPTAFSHCRTGKTIPLRKIRRIIRAYAS